MIHINYVAFPHSFTLSLFFELIMGGGGEEPIFKSRPEAALHKTVFGNAIREERAGSVELEPLPKSLIKLGADLCVSFQTESLMPVPKPSPPQAPPKSPGIAKPHAFVQGSPTSKERKGPLDSQGRIFRLPD